VGDTPDISEYAQFDWYHYVEYYSPSEAGQKEEKSKLGNSWVWPRTSVPV
jgi:hypothetical protein